MKVHRSFLPKIGSNLYGLKQKQLLLSRAIYQQYQYANKKYKEKEREEYGTYKCGFTYS